MKKSIFLLSVAFFAIFSVSAIFTEQKVVHSINLSLPYEHRTVEIEDIFADSEVNPPDTVTLNYFSANFNWNRMAIYDSGFSFLLGMGIGFTTAVPQAFFTDFLSGVRTDIKTGWGFAPINTDKMILAFHGFIAVNLRYLKAEEERAQTGSNANYTTYAYHIFDYDMPIGIDGVFVFKLGDSFALFTGLDLSTNLFGVGMYDADDHGEGGSEGYEFTYGFTGINVTPRIGICWVF